RKIRNLSRVHRNLYCRILALNPLGSGTRLLNLTRKQCRVKPFDKTRPHPDSSGPRPKSRITVEGCGEWAAQNLSFGGSETPLRIWWVLSFSARQYNTLNLMVCSTLRSALITSLSYALLMSVIT